MGIRANGELDVYAHLGWKNYINRLGRANRQGFLIGLARSLDGLSLPTGKEGISREKSSNGMRLIYLGIDIERRAQRVKFSECSSAKWGASTDLTQGDQAKRRRENREISVLAPQVKS